MPSPPTGARPLYLVAGLGSVGLAFVGAVLPGMPSTVFVILAAGCFARSSPRLEAWLENHETFGPPLRSWRTHRAIPAKAKVVALLSMAASGAFTLVTAPWAVSVPVGVFLVGSALYVGSRPSL
ncbi:MAG: YbaN family protein [Myxococcales bacterium]|nr:YbaN family protein [Myxococcales bacterium]